MTTENTTRSVIMETSVERLLGALEARQVILERAFAESVAERRSFSEKMDAERKELANRMDAERKELALRMDTERKELALRMENERKDLSRKIEEANEKLSSQQAKIIETLDNARGGWRMLAGIGVALVGISAFAWSAFNVVHELFGTSPK